MQKLTFQTLSSYGAMYKADFEAATVTNGEEFYRASEADAEIAALKEALVLANKYSMVFVHPCPECGGVEGCNVGCAALAAFRLAEQALGL